MKFCIFSSVRVVFITFLSVVGFGFTCLFSQESISVSIPWETPKKLKFKGEDCIVPSITDQGFLDFKPNFYWTRALNGSLQSSISLKSYNTQDALPEEIAYLSKYALQVQQTTDMVSKVTRSRGEVFAVVNLFPFVMENGKIKRITSIDLLIQTKPLKVSAHEKSAVASSVLTSGTWYKIGVKADGVFKIDKPFLDACGITTAGLDPHSINIYGNGDGKLPELNSTPRTDDLAKNAIYIEGESDGVFDATDYILFYAWGPGRWYPDGNGGFYHDQNIYSDISYYFININPAETPLRLSSINSTSLSTTQNVSSFSHYDTHESDLVSLVSGGQRWYGELFDVELSHTIDFTVPNIDNSVPATFKVSMASNATTSGGTSQTYKINGSSIFTSALPTGDYGRTTNTMQKSNPGSALSLEISVVRNSPSVLTYLDKVTLNARRNLAFSSPQFNFRDLQSVATGAVSQFLISGATSSMRVWEVTNRHIPMLVNGVLQGSTYSFQLETDTLRSFVAFDGSSFLIPEKVGFITNQNLHALPQADYLIVTHASFMTEANRLADLHRAEGLKVHIATTEQIYNEFSSGMLDPTAIRSFAKMFYDRGISTPETQPKYLLLFGDGTYDPKNRVANNNNFVPTYQVLNSEDHIAAMVTDDYFGFFDPSESISPSDLLDIGVGRLLISDLTMAKQQVDKIEHYMKNGSTLYSSSQLNCCSGAAAQTSTFGDWRLKYVLIADDEEQGYFIQNDTEPNSIHVQQTHLEMNCDKLYLDAYPQISNAGGQRYPEVLDAITDRVNRGALVVNYVGHGGETGVAEERVITIPQIQSWTNINQLNLLVSATCEFTKFDDPSRVSAGEWASLNPTGAAIALMTTTRSVYFGVNTTTGKKFYDYVFTKDANNLSLPFGEIIRLTKNAVGASDNKRSFTLIGDPALRIAYPKMKIVTDSINGLDPLLIQDTIRALSKLVIKGHIENFNNDVLTDFNGILSPTVFDKFKTLATMGQDSDSPIINFALQKNSLYRGKASVTNGYFEFSFIVPKDINYSFGAGKISYYAENGSFDAAGADTNLIIGGVDPHGIQDDEGPEIEIFLNDENFVNTGISDETPILIANLFDENGINTVGNGVGHDILAVLDGNTAKPIVLNDYYTADLDSYQSGSLSYSFPKLDPGSHSLSLKVWDVNNNSSEAIIEFTVQLNGQIALDHVLNYPNPFTTKTEFYFEHNQVCTEIETQIQIFTVSGKLVKTINKAVQTSGFRTSGIAWDGLDDFGDQLAKGVYIYRLSVRTADGGTADKTEKLVILK